MAHMGRIGVRFKGMANKTHQAPGRGQWTSVLKY